MERAKFDSPISPELMKEREKLLDTLKNNMEILRFIATNNLDESFIDENAFQLKDYLSRFEKCVGCKGLPYCTQEQTGYLLSIEYNDELIKVMKKCDYLEALEQSIQHGDKISINHMSEKQMTYTFESTEIMSESSSYIMLYKDLLKASKEETKEGFFLCGEPGVGKTYLASCYMNAMAKKGKKCAFVHVPTIIADLKTMMYDNVAFRRTIHAMKNCDVLVLDDVGGESASTWTRDDILLPLLNERMERGLTTLFTSNYSYANLEKFYTLKSKAVNDIVGAKRLVERMRSLGEEKVVAGSNRRMKKSRN